MDPRVFRLLASGTDTRDLQEAPHAQDDEGRPIGDPLAGVIAVCERELFLWNMLEVVRVQTYDIIKIIGVNAESTDNSEHALQRMRFPDQVLPADERGCCSRAESRDPGSPRRMKCLHRTG